MWFFDFFVAHTCIYWLLFVRTLRWFDCGQGPVVSRLPSGLSPVLPTTNLVPAKPPCPQRSVYPTPAQDTINKLCALLGKITSSSHPTKTGLLWLPSSGALSVFKKLPTNGFGYAENQWRYKVLCLDRRPPKHTTALFVSKDSRLLPSH